MKLRFSRTEGGHAHRAIACLNELDIESVFAKVSLFLRDIDRCLALTDRARRKKNASERRGGMKLRLDRTTKKQRQNCRDIFSHKSLWL